MHDDVGESAIIETFQLDVITEGSEITIQCRCPELTGAALVIIGRRMGRLFRHFNDRAWSSSASSAVAVRSLILNRLLMAVLPSESSVRVVCFHVIFSA